MNRREFLWGSLTGAGIIFSSSTSATKSEEPDIREIFDEKHTTTGFRPPADGSDAVQEINHAIPGVDALRLEIGYRLIPYVKDDNENHLRHRIKRARVAISGTLGFSVPLLHITDNLGLEVAEYRLLISGKVVGQGQVQPGHDLAILPEDKKLAPIPGIATNEPAFNLPGYWIQPSERDRASGLGYTVVDIPCAIATHFNEVLRSHAHSLLGFDEVHEWRNRLSSRMPLVASHLGPGVISDALLQQVLRALLLDGIPLIDQRTIGETLAQHLGSTRDPQELASEIALALDRIGTPGAFAASRTAVGA